MNNGFVISRNNKDYLGGAGWGPIKNATVYASVEEARVAVDNIDPEGIRPLHVRQVGGQEQKKPFSHPSDWDQKRIAKQGAYLTENNRARLAITKVWANCRLAFFHVHGRAGTLAEVQAFTVRLLAAEPEADRENKSHNMERGVWEPNHVAEMQRRQKSPMPLSLALPGSGDEQV